MREDADGGDALLQVVLPTHLRMTDLVKLAETISASWVISQITLKASRSTPPLRRNQPCRD